MRLTDAVFARMVVDVRTMIESIPPEQKADLDCEFLTAIAVHPNEILKNERSMITIFQKAEFGGGILERKE